MENKELKNLGNRIRIARKARGISMKSLAKITNDDVSNLYKIERGEMNFTFSRLQRTVNALGLELNINLHEKHDAKISKEDALLLLTRTLADMKSTVTILNYSISENDINNIAFASIINHTEVNAGNLKLALSALSDNS